MPQNSMLNGSENRRKSKLSKIQWQAIKNSLTDLLHKRAFTPYCPTCGACGESGCCKPTQCHYVNAYQGDYDKLVEENELMWSLLQKIKQDYPGVVHRYEAEAIAELWEEMKK